MESLLNRLLNGLMGILFGIFKRSQQAQPLPLPPPLPAGVPPTPAPLPQPTPSPIPAGHPLTDLLAGFVGHYNHVFVDVDHFAGAQCVDLINAWCDWIGQRRFPPIAGAGDWVYNHHPDMTWIVNTPNNIPHPGDAVVWRRSPTLPWGHVGLFLMGGVMQFHSFDQNWPYNSPCHDNAHSYVGVAGWFRPIHWKGQ